MIRLISERTSQEVVLNCTACFQHYFNYDVSSSDKELCTSQYLQYQVEEIPLGDNCKTILLTLNLTDKQWWNDCQEVVVVFTAVIFELSNGTSFNPPENTRCTATVNVMGDSTGKPCTHSSNKVKLLVGYYCPQLMNVS